MWGPFGWSTGLQASEPRMRLNRKDRAGGKGEKGQLDILCGPLAEHETLPGFQGRDAGSITGRWCAPGSGPRGCHSTEQYLVSTEQWRPRPPTRRTQQMRAGAAMPDPAGRTVPPTLHKTLRPSSILSLCRNDLLTIFNFSRLYQVAFNSPRWFCNTYVRSWNTETESKEEPRHKCHTC